SGALSDENRTRLLPVPIYVGLRRPLTEGGSLPCTPSKAYMALAREGGDAQPPNAHPCADISAQVPAIIPEGWKSQRDRSSPYIFKVAELATSPSKKYHP
ncbi:hypothetical protein MRX96_053609, partial [Rhipicephalus microplus]